MLSAQTLEAKEDKNKVQDFIKTLQKSHAEKKGDILERSFIDRLEAIAEKTTDDEILLGAIFFFSEQRYAKLGIFQSSVLCNLLNGFLAKKLDSTKADQQKIIFLNKFVQFANQQKMYLADFAEHKEVIEEHNRNVVKPLVQKITEPLNTQLDILYRMALIPTLEGQITDLPREYEEEKIKNPPYYISTFRPFDYSKERRRCLAITKILDSASIDQIMQSDPQYQTAQPSAKEYIKYCIRSGFLMYCLKLIASQPNSPKNSNLFKLAEQVFQTDDFNKIPVEQQKIYISYFNNFIQRTLFNDAMVARIESSGAFSKSTPASLFLTTMHKNIANDFKGIMANYVVPLLFITACSLSSFAIGIQIGKIAEWAWRKEFGKGYLPMVCGLMGQLIGGPAGRKIGEYAGQVYEAAVVPVVIAKGIGLAISGTYSMMTVSPEALARREAARSERYCLDLNQDIAQTMLSDVWSKQAKQELGWLLALAELAPEEFGRLINTIVKATEMQPLAAKTAEDTAKPSCKK